MLLLLLRALQQRLFHWQQAFLSTGNRQKLPLSPLKQPFTEILTQNDYSVLIYK